jgi:hypothetical protein
MFQSLTYFQYSYLSRESSYLLKDSLFSCKLLVSELLEFDTASGNTERCGGIRDMVPFVAAEYKKRNLHIPKNLALLYMSFKKAGWDISKPYLEFDMEWLDKDYPELEYGAKYYRCVCNQIKRLIEK